LKSVLIGHVFENMNIPLSCAWITFSAIGLSSFTASLCLESFCGFRCEFGEFFCHSLFHVLCTMAARPPRLVFAHRRTVRLTVEDDMTIDALQVIHSLPDYKGDITGVVPQFGGKCIDITLCDPEVAARLALSGFDYENIRQPLCLLGEKPIHVSVFGPVAFPDDTVVALLKQYGDLKSENLRRLYFQEEGFNHIKLHRDVPRCTVTQGVEINIKYTGQLVTCRGKRSHQRARKIRKYKIKGYTP